MSTIHLTSTVPMISCCLIRVVAHTHFLSLILVHPPLTSQAVYLGT